MFYAAMPYKPPIILASTSNTRRQLLTRLNVPFDVISPEIDESPLDNETAQELARRLARQKSSVVAAQFPHALVIGSDQVVWRDAQPDIFIGKPLTINKAIEQLRLSSGKKVNFETAVSVQCVELDFEHTELVHFSVQFRELDEQEIKRYVSYDQPLHCSGSFKVESLGLSLFESMQGDDFTALMGLPTLKLCQLLRQLNWQLP